MKSPITGKEMERLIRPDELQFRKESFPILYHYYWDKVAAEEFTDEELDTLNTNQVYNQYRSKYHLPFPDEIKETRDKYGLSQAKMAEVLGFGINMYRHYESGEIPTISNARLIQLAGDPAEFRKLVDSSIEVLDEKDKANVYKRIEALLDACRDFQYNGLPQYLMSGGDPNGANCYTGYRRPNLKKMLEMIVYFASEVRPFKTQLNKLLFYADFYHYKRYACSISGAIYCAIAMGPVPHHFNSIFEYATASKHIDICYHEFSKGKYGEEFIQHPERKFDKRMFSDEELDTLQLVKERLGKVQTQDIIELSHRERAWKENIEGKKKISYDYAFELEIESTW